MRFNQAVIFTKPVHHLKAGLTPSLLSQKTRAFFEEKNFCVTVHKTITGTELAEREVIKQHYHMYSAAACDDVISITTPGENRFLKAFGKEWDEEVEAGHILPTARLLTTKGIHVHELFAYWNNLFTQKMTHKIQDGLIMAWIDELNAYGINAFYPSVEALFYNPETRIDYFVMEFDPSETSWEQFRKKILGNTNASKADPESFRGQLYREYPDAYPGRDNFVHGSAGPFEGLVERTIHEIDFEMNTNPVGAYLVTRGITREAFSRWITRQSITALGELFDATEEKNTDNVILLLENVEFEYPLDNDPSRIFKG